MLGIIVRVRFLKVLTYLSDSRGYSQEDQYSLRLFPLYHKTEFVAKVRKVRINIANQIEKFDEESRLHLFYCSDWIEAKSCGIKNIVVHRYKNPS